ncbi:hypothetical protein L208DRAFT_1327277 [Tricholoma matsutake]|nr:hypothetical protein L208DRAFT_1327277 [Tricholoma matsutake 945]
MFPALSLTTVAVSAGIYLCLSSGIHTLRRKLVQTETGMVDVPFLGNARPKDRKIQGTAVVCGGSIAGLATARVCHDHFEQVIIVEPEAWLVTTEGWKPEREPMAAKTRTRVLQYQSLHVLLAFGFLALEKLFSINLKEECEKADISIRPADLNLAPYGHFFDLGDEKSRNALPRTLFSTRHGLETLLRRLIIGTKQYPNIEQIVGTVTGVICSASDPTRLQGVSVRTSDGDKTLGAALIIDCSGPAEAGLKWLRRAGFGAANPHSDGDDSHPLQQLKTVYDPRIRYSTFQFTLPPALAERLPIPGGYHNTGGIYNCIPDGRVEHKSIYAMRYEGDTFQLCCGTRGDIEQPKNLDEVITFAKDIIVDKPIPEWFFKILDALHEVEASATITNVNLSSLSYIKYHQARNLPDNYIAIGDSILRVNPIYGHGCSKAIMGAVTLNTVLKSTDSQNYLPVDFSKRFFDAQAAKIDPIWEGTKILDYGFNCTVPVEGETLRTGAFLRWYLRRLHMVSFRDRQAGLASWEGIHLLSPSIDYFQPGIVLKILWDIWKRPHV